MSAFRIRGMAETKAALAKVELQIEAASPEAVKQGGEVVADNMRARAPRRTGELSSQIGVAVSSLGEGAKALVGSDAPYDRFVQRGTVHMAAQPYGEEASEETAAVAAAIAAVYKAAIG